MNIPFLLLFTILPLYQFPPQKLTGDETSDPKVADESTNEMMGDILYPAASVLHLHNSVRDDPHNFGEPPRFDVLALQSSLDDLADGIQLEGNGVCAAEALEGLSVSEDDVYLGTEPDFVDFGFVPLVHDKVLKNVWIGSDVSLEMKNLPLKG